jgi:hypothetical protein
LIASAPAGREAAAKLGRPLVYFGAHHLNSELAHTLNEDDVSRTLEGTTLVLAERERLFRIVDQVYGCFEAFLDGTYQAIREKSAVLAP